MAKNIKKRSASHIYFGVNKLTGELKHISEVPSGQKCNCICAACLQPFEARKGTRRRHHFAHVSNYECMYASEVAIYKAFAEALKQSGFLTLSPVMLRFPAWHDPELLQEARRLKIDSVAFECEPLSYPPLLRVTMQGTPLRILLDFDRYYDDDDRVELAEEAKAEDYSLLLISMPKIEQDTEFTPDRLQSALQDNDRTEWVFSRLEEQWKQKNKKGIYTFVFDGDESSLNLRQFSASEKRVLYERCGGFCKRCGPKIHYKIEEMEADHIKPWSDGGKTELDNGQMLCKHHNRVKGNK